MMDIAQATHLDVEAGVRYWEDASVNGVDEDNDAPTIFGVNGDTWRIRINIAEGRLWIAQNCKAFWIPSAFVSAPKTEPKF